MRFLRELLPKSYINWKFQEARDARLLVFLALQKNDLELLKISSKILIDAIKKAQQTNPPQYDLTEEFLLEFWSEWIKIAK